nr:cytochrome P450 94C1-like [Ipomoea batatas]
MELEPSWRLRPFEENPLSFFFFITAFFLLFLFYLLRIKLWCDCHVCNAYINSTWKSHFTNLADWYTHLLRSSPTGTIHIHVLRNIVTANPDNVEYMLKTRFDNFPKGKAFSAILGDFLGRGIFNVDGDSWLFQRKMASHQLGSSSIRSYAFDVVQSEIDRRILPLLASNDGAVLDLQDVFRRFAFDSICRFSFGLDPKCLESLLAMPEFAASISDEIYLRDIVISFLLAGRDTVAAALTSFFWLAANHPEVPDAILAEADSVLGPNKNPTKCDHLGDLHYLQAAVYESMRLFPPIQFDSKFCLEDDVLPDGTVVKKGTRVTYHPYAMGRMEEIWGEDCLEFKPERWLNNGVFFQENPFKYPVFQGGLRVCLGKEMAVLEVRTVVLSLLRRFRIELAQPHDRSPPRFSPGLTASFYGGLPVLVRERRGSSAGVN